MENGDTFSVLSCPQRTSQQTDQSCSTPRRFMRTLEAPLEMQEMMRLARYRNAVPELRWDFRYREMPAEVYIEVDSDSY